MLKDVYFWNTSKLSELLAMGEVSDFVALKHLILCLALFNLGFQFPFLTIPNPSHPTTIVILSFVGHGLVNCAGLIWLFQIHQKHTQNGFFRCLACFCLPAAVKATLVFVVIYVVIVLAFTGITGGRVKEQGLLYDFFVWAIEVFALVNFYYLMSNYFRSLTKMP